MLVAGWGVALIAGAGEAGFTTVAVGAGAGPSGAIGFDDAAGATVAMTGEVVAAGFVAGGAAGDGATAGTGDPGVPSPNGLFPAVGTGCGPPHPATASTENNAVVSVKLRHIEQLLTEREINERGGEFRPCPAKSNI